MKGVKEELFLDAMCDSPDEVEVELQERGGKRVLYVHVNGQTCFRLTGIETRVLIKTEGPNWMHESPL